jgi:uncharacterized protein (DUF362 family)
MIAVVIANPTPMRRPATWQSLALRELLNAGPTRTIVDLVSARPIDLAVVEGIKTMTGGEGPWVGGRKTGVSPRIMVAGTNCVNIDAVCMAVMGFDPMADRGTPPFEQCDSTLRLAEDVGLGTRDLKRIEVAGTPIREALFDFATPRRERLANRGRA